MNNVLAGAAMGAALTASGVHQPATILSQFDFTNFHMLQTFLTAAAGSTLLLTATQTLSLTHLAPKPPSSVGLLSTSPSYDGNILGGALLGTGMALSGACPGTVLVQLGVGGVRSGVYAFGGAVLAGLIWSLLVPRPRSRRRQQPEGINLVKYPCNGTVATTTTTTTVTEDGEEGEGTAKGKGIEKRKEMVTVHEALGVSRIMAAGVFEVVCVLAVLAASSRARIASQAKLSPVLGGLLIAAAQVVSLVLRGRLLGTSTSYEDMGRLLMGDCPRGPGNILFSGGVVAGAWALSRVVPALAQVNEVSISPVMAGLGGFLMVLGSRMAGGCTSGHGISGISLLSTSSFLTVATTFAAGGVVGLLLG